MMYDHVDRYFFSMLDEIEQLHFFRLTQHERVRVKKWITKLTSKITNKTLKLQRNMYAKLLVNMLINEKLEAPFHVAPPEGSLKAFPSEYKYKLHENLANTRYIFDYYLCMSAHS